MPALPPARPAKPVPGSARVNRSGLTGMRCLVLPACAQHPGSPHHPPSAAKASVRARLLLFETQVRLFAADLSLGKTPQNHPLGSRSLPRIQSVLYSGKKGTNAPVFSIHLANITPKHYTRSPIEHAHPGGGMKEEKKLVLANEVSPEEHPRSPRSSYGLNPD